MKSKTQDNKDIFFEVKGNLQSTNTLVFLNGLTQNTDSWALMTPFFEKDYKVVLLDFVLQGRSEKESAYRDFNTHANDVLTVLDVLGINESILVGISYGSLVAQHFAVLFPDRLKKLVLMSTFANKTPFYRAIELSWKHALEIGGYELFLDVMLPYVLSDQYFLNPIIPIELIKSSKLDSSEVEALMKLMQATLDRKDFRKELNNIKCSTLILHGKLDRLFPTYLGEEVAKNIPNSTFEIIENVGHTLNIEGVREVSNKILEFISKL